MFAKECCTSMPHFTWAGGLRWIPTVKYSYGLIFMPKSSFIENLLLAVANVSLAQERLHARVSQGLSKQPHRLNQNICEASLGKQGGNAISDAFFFKDHVSNKTAFLQASPPFNVSDNRCNRLECSFKGGLQEREQGLCGNDVVARNDKDWKLQSLSAISMRELMKITELRFSGDMREGDSGEQVALLQRGLFWLGYFPRDLSISGYFGPGTKQALQRFQKAHGVANTGLWGSLSREALWNYLSIEILHRLGDENYVPKYGEFEAARDSPFIGNDRDRLSQIGSQLSQKIKEFDVRKVSENIAIAVSTPNWKPVKRRILRSEWYTDASSRANRAKTRAVYQPDKDSKPLCFCSDFNLAPTMEDQGGGRGELVNCNGQVLRGSSSAVGEINGGNLIAFKNSVGQYRSRNKVSPAALLVVGDQSPHLDSNTYGIGSHQLQNGIEHHYDISQLSGSEESPRNEHGFIHWIKHVFSKFDLGSLATISTYRQSKRRIVVRNTIRRLARKAGRRSYERIKAQRSCILERAPIPASPRSSWQEKAERNLKKNIEELCKAVEAAEQNRRAALDALAQERQQNLELEVKIRRQRKAAAALEEEVRVLKESHDALLDSLRNKYSSSVAARAAAALLYQNWDSNHAKSINTSKIVQNDGARGRSFS